MPQGKTVTDTAEPVPDRDGQAATDAETNGSNENSAVPWTTVTKTAIDEELAALTATPVDEPKAEDGADASLPLDEVFAVLKNERRRRVLGMLTRTGDTISLSDLAEEIAALETDKPIRQVTSSERKRVYVGLYQCHLPKMDSLDVVDFNKPRGTVARGATADDVYDYLETATGAEPDWHRYSTTLSVGGAAALGTALLVDPMTTLPVLDGTVGCLLIVFVAYGLGAFGWSRSAD